MVPMEKDSGRPESSANNLTAMQQDHQDRLMVLAGANLSLAGVSEFLQRLMPYLNSLLVIVQVLVGLFTLLHIFRKVKYDKNRNSRRARRKRHADGKRLRADTEKG